VPVEMGEHVAGQIQYRILSGRGKVELPNEHLPNSLGAKLPSVH
jgi:hypothetical protein